MKKETEKSLYSLRYGRVYDTVLIMDVPAWMIERKTGNYYPTKLTQVPNRYVCLGNIYGRYPEEHAGMVNWYHYVRRTLPRPQPTRWQRFRTWLHGG